MTFVTICLSLRATTVNKFVFFKSMGSAFALIGITTLIPNQADALPLYDAASIVIIGIFQRATLLSDF